MAQPFKVRVGVRGYEVDTQGHLNQAVYLQYGEHARWEFLRALGIPQDKLIASGVGPVALETTLRFHRELRSGDEVDVSCAFEWTGRKTFLVKQEFHRVSDGVLAAEITAVVGILDLEARRLVPDPAERFRALATNLELLDL